MNQQLTSLLADLREHYECYNARCQDYIAKHSGVEHLGEWIFGNDRFAQDSMHTDFHQGVEQRVAGLDQALAQATGEEAEEAALQALAVIVDPMEDKERGTSGWMRFAAETLSAPLLKYLSQEKLEQFAQRYNTFYPKRMQFPNQKAYRKEMEKLLREKKGRRW